MSFSNKRTVGTVRYIAALTNVIPVLVTGIHRPTGAERNEKWIPATPAYAGASTCRGDTQFVEGIAG